MGGRLLEGRPWRGRHRTGVRSCASLAPFLEKLGHKARRRMCPLYVAGLIGPGDRKSVQPMAERLAPGDYDQLHHFIADGVWDAAPLETELLIQADRLVGGDAVLVIDDTALPKKGDRSVGVAAQYASALGKTANCQTMVSLTLARGEVPVMVGLRLFLPESWTSDNARLKRAGVPAGHRNARTKPEIALAEIDRVMAAGVRFGCVLADAGYGLSAPFRQGLTARGLTWAVGVPRRQKVYPAHVKLIFPVAGRGALVNDISRILYQVGRRDAGGRQMAICQLAARNQRRIESTLRRRPRARRRRTAAADRRQGSAASSWRRGLADRRTPHVRRDEVLSRQPAVRNELAQTGCHRQSAMDLRAGASATERRARSRSLRGTILARSSSSRPDDDDRLRFPPASPSRQSGAGKKESTGRLLNQPCPPCAAPSSLTSCARRQRDVLIAENQSQRSNGWKSAKVVLGAIAFP